jgi:hypothetical protein
MNTAGESDYAMDWTVLGLNMAEARDTVTMLWAEQSGVSTEAGGKQLFSTPKCPNQLWGLSSLLFNGHSDSFPDSKVVTAQIYHSPLRTNRTTHLLHLYIFMAWTGETFFYSKGLLAFLKQGHNSLFSE